MKYIGPGFAVDSATFTVERDGAQIDLEPQAIDLLLLFLTRRGELISKADLLTEVWGDQFVSESALTTRIKQIRRALGDDGKAQRIVQTVHGRGYRFVADVDERADDEPLVDTQAVGNLPAARTPLIGRAELLATVSDVVAQYRLVSLIGLGGAGKTALAQQSGRDLEDRFPAGVWFVDLIPVRDAAGLDAAVGQAMGLQLSADADRGDLLRLLANREILLLLDNCEHIADDVAAFCSDVLNSTLRPRMLTTSREPLRVVGEHRINVGPLPVMADGGGAIDLLRLVADRYGASIGSDEQLAAVSLCSRVDGLPLAIELVGARLSTLGVSEIVDRLDRITSTGAPERRAERHASLATVLADTIDLLGAEDVRLLTLLARLDGDIAIDDVEEIGAHAGIEDPVDRFGTLADLSLLVTSNSGRRRFSVLETVRQHVARVDPAPDQTAAVISCWIRSPRRSSMHVWFLDLAHAEWVGRRFADVMNVVHEELAAGRPEGAAAALTSVGLAMHLDDGNRARRVLDLLPTVIEAVADPVLVAQLHCCGVLAAMGGRSPRRIREHGTAAVAATETAVDPALRAVALVLRSWSAVVTDPADALDDVDEAIELAERAGDPAVQSMATGYKVLHLAMAARFDEATRLGESSFERAGDPDSYGRAAIGEALVSCLAVDRPHDALELHESALRSVVTSRVWGSETAQATAHAAAGDVGTAVEVVDRIAARLERAGVEPLPDLLVVPAALARRRGDDARLARFVGAVRGAPRPTQSLQVSAAYKALRSHVRPSTVHESTESVWDEALAWMRSIADAECPLAG